MREAEKYYRTALQGGAERDDNLRQALRMVNRALIYKPRNQAAEQLKARITEATGLKAKTLERTEEEQPE